MPAPAPYVADKPCAQQSQQDAAWGLVSRLLPSHADCFSLSLAPPRPGSHGFFSVEVSSDGIIIIEGSSGTQLASGVHWFLKYFAQSSVSWEQTGGLQVNTQHLTPEGRAALSCKGKVVVERAVPLSFYQNVVTMSYSMAFWDWHRWEAELDWMALQGINMPLMPLGMEALLQATFVSLGPAFLAWGRMGNIQGYAGPLPQAYMDSQLELARRVVQRMREFGMTPVYPGFAGFVPRALAELYPEAATTPASNWCHFPANYCCPLLLDPADPLFATIGATYIRTLRAHLGWDTTSYYIADSFNEMKPASDSPQYLAGVSASVFAGMTAADPQATWVMQAWLFFSDSHFWQPPQIQALLSGVPHGRLLLLDLFADEHPIWSRTSALYGHPFIWCMLHNFGGNLEMYGALPAVAEGVTAALAAAPDNLVGVGMAPEGIEQNPAVYEFMAEMAFKGRAEAAAQPGGLAAWFRDYARRRYAGAGSLAPGSAAAIEGAWQLLARSVYSCRDKLHNTVADIPTSRPGLTRAEIVGWGLAPHLWYDVGDVRAAWELLLQAASASPTLAACSSAFTYDLLDVSRELMSKIAGRFWADVVTAYKEGNLGGVRSNGSALLRLLADMDELLGTHKGFMLGPVLARARAYATANNGSNSAPASDGDGDALVAVAIAATCGGSSSSGSLADLGVTAARTNSMASSGSRRSLDSSETAFPSDEANASILPQQAVAVIPIADEEQLASFYEWNLRTQLTIWGTSAVAGDSEVSDYANKEWSGLIASFYLPRWRAWLARLEADLLLGQQYDAAAWRLEVLMMTYHWISTGSTIGTGSNNSSNRLQAAAMSAATGDAADVPDSVFSASQADINVQQVANQPAGQPVELSSRAYESYARLLPPGCAATTATAAAAAAAAAAGMGAAPLAFAAVASPPATSVVAAAAAAVVVGAAAAVAVAGTAPTVQVVEEVIA